MGGRQGKSFSPNKGKHGCSSGDNKPLPAKSGQPESLDYIEGVVCKENEIKDNQMKLLPLGEDGGKILLIKQDGELHALGSKCSHYGALLSTGALGEGRVRCPWHGACFNIKTGDIEDYPGLDSLPCYKVSVDQNGDVKVRAKRRELETNKRTKQMAVFKAENAKTVVIVGGGPSGATCAESLRQEGFTGRIVMVCKENALPYDRPKLTKVMDADVEKILLRSQFFYNEHNIETLLGKEAIGLDTDRKTVKLSSNEDLSYDHLFIATGSKPRPSDLPGAELANIFVMRDHTNSAAIVAQLTPEKHVVLLGLGFIGMEAAAYCVGKCASVTVVGRDSVPMKSVFGEEIGNRIKKEFEQKGVRFILNNNIARFLPTDDGKSVQQVELLDGTFLESNIVILGLGSTFNTDWLKETQLQLLDNGEEKATVSTTAVNDSKRGAKRKKGKKLKKGSKKEEGAKAVEKISKFKKEGSEVKDELPLTEANAEKDVTTTKVEVRSNGTVVVDKFLRTNVENVYAGGDIAFAPVYSAEDLPASIGHFGLSHYHGKIAALNICGKETPLRAVPFFWTMLFGRSYRYAGHGRPTGIKIVGSLEDFKFFAYYFKNGKVIAMSSVGRDPIVSDFANLLYEGRQLTEEEVERDPLAWMPNKPEDLLPTVSPSDIKS